MSYSCESVIHLAIVEWKQNVLVALYYQCIVCRMVKLITVCWRAEEWSGEENKVVQTAEAYSMKSWLMWTVICVGRVIKALESRNEIRRPPIKWIFVDLATE